MISVPWCHWCSLRKAATILDGQPSCNECATPVPSPIEEDGPTYLINDPCDRKPDGCKHCGCGLLPEWNGVCPECKFIQARKPSSDRAEYARERRERLKRANLCIDSANHGAVYKWNRCRSCFEKQVASRKRKEAA